MQDDELVAQAIATRARLAPRFYTITTPIVLGPGNWLRGSGLNTVIATETPGLTLVQVTGTSTMISDLHLGRFDWPTKMGIGIQVSGLYDRTLIDNVWIDGKYTTACMLVSNGAASSSIRHSTFWNYEPERFTAIYDSVSDWSLFQTEHHQQSVATTSAVVWLLNSSAVRFFGGNVSFKTGNGCPGYVNQNNVNYMTYPPGPNLWYGTTFYQEP